MTRALADHPELIVVVGGGVLPDGNPAPATLARAQAAASLALERRRAAIICSGSHGEGGRPERTEAVAMADALVARGVARERIFLEDRSRDTPSNAAYVAERYLAALAPRPLVLVTSPFHMARALETFRLVLGPRWPLEAHPSRVVPGDDERARTEDQYLAITRARLDGLTPGDVPRIVERVRATLSQNVAD